MRKIFERFYNDEDPLFIHKISTLIGALLGFLFGVYVVSMTEEFVEEEVEDVIDQDRPEVDG